MMNPTKFGSPKLDNPSSRYQFLKFAFKSMKINQKNHFNSNLQLGSTVNGSHPSARPAQSMAFDRQELIVDKVTGDEVFTVGLPTTPRVEWYPWLAWRFTGATSPASMAARRWRAIVSPSTPVTVSLGEHCCGIYKS